MREPRTTRMFLVDIMESIGLLGEFTRGMDFSEFADDRRTQAAVVRYLEIIGEAVKNLPETLRSAHPEVNWRAMAAMRDRLIHAYFGASDRIVWDTVEVDLPVLESQVRGILEGLGPSP